MKIRLVGAGFYGCHLAASLISDGHDVQIWEIKDRIFGGASGNIPARGHIGVHYPRSKKTRDACLEHMPQFMEVYGKFTHHVPTNIYAIAQDRSMVDYGNYIKAISGEIQFIEINPEEYGLRNCEGAILTQERHIVTDDVRAHFEKVLDGHIIYNKPIDVVDSKEFDLTIDCSFCANDSAGIDRYEPCIVGLLSGPTNFALTVMDGEFGSVYPWNESKGLCSLSSAKYTPFSKSCKTYEEAKYILEHLSDADKLKQMQDMFDDLGQYYPALHESYAIVEPRLSIRAMPLSGADSRLVDVVECGGRAVRIRAGKIDAVVQAERIIKDRYVKG